MVRAKMEVVVSMEYVQTMRKDSIEVDLYQRLGRSRLEMLVSVGVD